MSAWRKLFGTAAAIVATSVAGAASADGLCAAPGDLSAEEGAELSAQIASFKASSPQAFDDLRKLRGHRPEVYGQYRSPLPIVSRELRGLGKDALLPMLEALVFDAPPLDGLSPGEQGQIERQALTLGMLHAVGKIRDARALPALNAIFAAHPEGKIAGAAAEGLGRSCDDASLSTLEGALAGDKRGSAIDGLGQCRRIEGAKRLAHELEHAQDPKEAARIAESLGMMGSSWAWKALGPSRAKEGQKARAIAAEALVKSYLRHADAGARAKHASSLGMVEHADMATLVQRHRALGSPAAVKELEAIAARVKQSAAQ